MHTLISVNPIYLLNRKLCKQQTISDSGLPIEWRQTITSSCPPLPSSQSVVANMIANRFSRALTLSLHYHVHNFINCTYFTLIDKTCSDCHRVSLFLLGWETARHKFLPHFSTGNWISMVLGKNKNPTIMAHLAGEASQWVCVNLIKFNSTIIGECSTVSVSAALLLKRTLTSHLAFAFYTHISSATLFQNLKSVVKSRTVMHACSGFCIICSNCITLQHRNFR